jgi:hypothetical protein
MSLSRDSLLSPVSKSSTFKAAPPVPQYTFLPSKVRSFFSSLPQSKILEDALLMASSTKAGENFIILLLRSTSAPIFSEMFYESF